MTSHEAPAFATRGARRRQAEAVDAARPALVNLDNDTLHAVLKLLPLPSLIKLGACSRMLHDTSCMGMFWTSIHLEDFPLSVTKRVDDAALSKLLIRVDARNHTHTLSLRNGCHLSLACLLPLKGSSTLRQLDMRRANSNSPFNCDLIPRPSRGQNFEKQLLTLLKPMVERKQLTSFLACTVLSPNRTLPRGLCLTEHPLPLLSCAQNRRPLRLWRERLSM